MFILSVFSLYYLDYSLWFLLCLFILSLSISFCQVFLFFLCVFLFMFLYKSVFIFLFYIIFFLLRCKYRNINIIYIYLNVYLCFCFSVSFFLLFCFNGYSFLICLKWFFCFTLDEIVVFLMFIYLLILYDRLSLCFVVCFSSWLLGFYVFIYLIKYVYAFLFGFIAFWLLAFLFYCLQLLPFFSSNVVFGSYTFVSFYAYFFYFSCSLFVCVII